MPETIPEECQLCRLLEYRGDEINAPSHSIEVRREDGGIKIVYLCQRCASEMGWDDDPTLDRLEQIQADGGLHRHRIEAVGPVTDDLVDEVDELIADSRYSEDEIYDTVETFYMAGLKEDEVLDMLRPSVEFAVEQQTGPAMLADQVVTAIHLFDLDFEELNELFEEVKQTAIDHPVTTTEVLNALAVAGPVAIHENYTSTDLIEMIGQESRKAPTTLVLGSWVARLIEGS